MCITFVVLVFRGQEQLRYRDITTFRYQPFRRVNICITVVFSVHSEDYGILHGIYRARETIQEPRIVYHGPSLDVYEPWW